MRTACRQLFVEAEGIELMVLILKQRQQVRFGALKAVVGRDVSSEVSVPSTLFCWFTFNALCNSNQSCIMPQEKTVHHGCEGAMRLKPITMQHAPCRTSPVQDVHKPASALWMS